MNENEGHSASSGVRRRRTGMGAARPWCACFPMTLILACAFSSGGADCLAGTPRIGGRFGLEIDGIGEDYRAPGLADERLLSDGSVEVQFEDQPVREREAAVLGLLDLRLDIGASGARWLTLENRVRAGGQRQRNLLRFEAGAGGTRARGRLEGEWDWQGGSDNPAAGNRAAVTGVYDRDSLPFGFDMHGRLTGEWSTASADSFAALFDYRSLRGEAQLRRDLSERFDLRILGGAQRRVATNASTGSFRERYAELGVNGHLRTSDRLETTLRLENRDYDHESLGIPSSDARSALVRYERRVTSRVRPFVETLGEMQDYARASAVFQDHRLLTSQAGADWSLRPHDEPDGLAGYRLRTAVTGEWFRSDTVVQDSLTFSTNYDMVGVLAGIATEALGDVWFDISLSAGVRNYLATPASQLTFEGWNFSLSASDFVFARLSGLVQWSPVTWLRHDLFFQWDEEIHDPRSDDFRLWILNLTVTYPFD